MKCKPYLKIFVKGVISFSIISGLYSWMSHVHEFQIMPDTYEYNIAKYERGSMPLRQNGITCISSTNRYSAKNIRTCNTMTSEIVNITTNNASIISQQCITYIHSNGSLYDTIPVFTAI
eukprot:286271_1